MTIAKAVASSVKTPGTYLVVNLLGGTSNPGSAALRGLIMSPQNVTGGDLTDDTEVRQIFGSDDAAIAFGFGNPGHLAAVLLFRKFGVAAIDVISPAPGAGNVATETITLTGSVSENSTLRFRVHGRTIDVPWNSGEALTVAATRSVGTINGQAADLFITAVDTGAGVITFNAKGVGPRGNDVRIGCIFITGGTGGGITAGATKNLAGGTVEPDFTVALSTVATTEYRCILAALSNADATDATSGSNAELLSDHIDQFETGNNALLQVGLVGHTGIIADVQGGAIGRNQEAMEYVYFQDSEDLPAEVAGDEMGDTLSAISVRSNANRIGNKMSLYGPEDPVVSKLTEAEVESLLNNGVTPVDLESNTNEPFLVRPITTHSQDAGNPDFRALDMSDTYGMYEVATDLRIVLPQEFKNASITPNLPEGDNSLPAGVVEVRDIEGFVTNRLRFWVDAGVVQGPALDAAISNGDLNVDQDAGDPTQVNIFLPLVIVDPLAKLGVVAAKVA